MCQLAKLIGLAAAIGLLGCAQENKPSFANVSGTVTYNGQPIGKGQITFSNDGRPPTVADIVDGKYTGQAMIGSNKVTISAFRKAAKERVLPPQVQEQVRVYTAMNKGQTGEAFDLSMEDYIPDEWGKKTTQVRVVEAGAPNTFDFIIKGK